MKKVLFFLFVNLCANDFSFEQNVRRSGLNVTTNPEGGRMAHRRLRLGPVPAPTLRRPAD